MALNIPLSALYKSTNGADSWTRLNVGDKVLFPNGLAYDSDNPKRLYLGAWSDIYLSDLIGGGLTGVTGRNNRFDLDGGIFMSEDGGETWSSIFDKDH